MDGSFLEKPSDFSIEDIGGFSRDGRVARSNTLPSRSMFAPSRFVTFPDYIIVTLTSANFPVIVFRVSQSATQLQR